MNACTSTSYTINCLVASTFSLTSGSPACSQLPSILTSLQDTLDSEPLFTVFLWKLSAWQADEFPIYILFTQRESVGDAIQATGNEMNPILNPNPILAVNWLWTWVGESALFVVCKMMIILLIAIGRTKWDDIQVVEPHARGRVNSQGLTIVIIITVTLWPWITFLVKANSFWGRC